MKNNFNFRMTGLNFSKFTLLLVFAILFGCSAKNKEIESKKLEDIQKEMGIPVKIKIIEAEIFEKSISFYSTLMGIKESTKTSPISDKIESILFRAGQYVKEGQVVIKFPTDNPTLQFEQAKIAYDNLQKSYNRLKELLKTGETSQQNFDNIEAQFLVAKRNYESLKQMLFVEAPISGIISNIYVTEGEQAESGKPLFTVSVLNQVRAIAWANEKEIQMLHPGMKGKILWNGSQFPCNISTESLKMDAKTKGFRVEFVANNPQLTLKSGITVEIQVPVYRNVNAISVPTYLVFKENNEQAYVWVEKNGIAEKRNVVIGNTNGTMIEIVRGLSKGERLIVEGNSLLTPNAKVKIID
jgi:RND family efflux transporter MFP subunit